MCIYPVHSEPIHKCSQPIHKRSEPMHKCGEPIHECNEPIRICRKIEKGIIGGWRIWGLLMVAIFLTNFNFSGDLSHE